MAIVRELCAKGLAAAAGVQLRAHTMEMLGAVLELKLLPNNDNVNRCCKWHKSGVGS